MLKSLLETVQWRHVEANPLQTESQGAGVLVECPICKQNTLLQVEVADICQNEDCNYSQGYI